MTEDDELTQTIDNYGTIRYRNSKGFLHRKDGPAITQLNGSREWWQDGELHRTGGPAIEWAGGAREWYQNGVLHREDGPAVVWPVARHEEWWLNGKQVTKDDHALIHGRGRTRDLQRNLSLYLASHGWEPRDPGVAGRIWDHDATGLSVAVPHEVQEGSLDWRSITTRLAEAARVTIEQVAADIMLMSTSETTTTEEDES